jgi:predicted RNA methylase
MVAGVGAGSLCWVSLLAAGVATARRAIGDRGVRIADAIAGTGLLAFGCALAAHAA